MYLAISRRCTIHVLLARVVFLLNILYSILQEERASICSPETSSADFVKSVLSLKHKASASRAQRSAMVVQGECTILRPAQEGRGVME